MHMTSMKTFLFCSKLTEHEKQHHFFFLSLVIDLFFNWLSKEQEGQKEENMFTFTPNTGIKLRTSTQTCLSFDRHTSEMQKHNINETKISGTITFWKLDSLDHWKIFGTEFHNILFHFEEVFLPWLVHLNKLGPFFYLKLINAKYLHIY